MKKRIRNMKKGIELEYWVIDEKGRLDHARKISKNFEWAEPEFVEPLLEIRTEPYEDIEKLRNEMFDRVRKSVKKAREEDLRIVPTGTPLNSGPIDVLEGSQRVELEKEFFPEHNVMDRTRAGTHIHFEQTDTVKQLNLATALDPASSLLNSSPYHDGERLASSSRNYFYRYAWDCKFPENVGLWPYTDSVDEWKERIQERFGVLENAALTAGVKEEEFHESFQPEDSVWIPIRLREEFNTVEWRSGDAAVPSEVYKLLEEFSRLMEMTKSEEIEFGESSSIENSIILPRFNDLADISEDAAEKGIGSRKVREHLEGVDIDTERFDPLSSRIEKEKDEIDMDEARRLRIEAAKILEDDVL